MSIQNKNKADPNFEIEVRTGLGSFPKRLSSKFIYDKKGDRLFQQIMEMPTYYLYDCEYEILERYSKQLSELFCKKGETINLIDLGAGDGKKTKILLRYMVQNDFDFVYKPIDISKTILEELKNSLKKELPTLKVEPETGEYFQVLNRLKNYNKTKKVILVLGSNIGNLLHPRAIEFMSSLKDALNPGDLLFMGFDQKKIRKPFLMHTTIRKESRLRLTEIYCTGSMMSLMRILNPKNSRIGKFTIPKPELQKVIWLRPKK